MTKWSENQLVRYIVVGGVAYVVEMGVLFGLRDGLDWQPVQAVAVSFWAGLIVAFVLQKVVAFRNYDRRLHVLGSQIVIYGLLVAWNYAFTLLMVHIFADSISVFIVRTAVIAIVTVWNFLIYRILFKNS